VARFASPVVVEDRDAAPRDGVHRRHHSAATPNAEWCTDAKPQPAMALVNVEPGLTFNLLS
jgi:hypothetical protein